MLIIAILAVILRIIGINWDQGFHLHPDERMLIIVADRIKFFSNLNPDFFNYGTLPIYLLKGFAQLSDSLFTHAAATYDGMLPLGRLLSVAADIGTLFLVYHIALLLFKKKDIALYASFAYAITFFVIQNTHFFVVDVFLTFFMTAAVYCTVRYLHKPTTINVLLIALSSATALATKFTSVLLIPIIAFALLIPILNKTQKPKIQDLLFNFSLYLSSTLLLHMFFMPYAYLSWSKFLTDTLQQTQMSRDAYIFPYTLQYVGTLPYFYFLKNIFLWGIGPLLSILAATGIYQYAKSIKFHKNFSKTLSENSNLIFVSGIYLVYFLVLGISAVKFMRYMLPIYPFFAILAGLGLYFFKEKFGKYAFYAAIILSIIWTGMFVGIYTQKHSRIVATEWIVQNIPAGSTIAIEHWDDRLPLVGNEQYQFVELPLYDQPDNEFKWKSINDKLSQADYIILASNRLHTPLQRLIDCKKYRSCYPITAKYYHDLLSGKLDFEKVYEGHIHPLLIDDQSADESFTVYDHPKILIYQKK